MNEYAFPALLGIVQGLTEFLPVSSSGHLIIASSLLGLDGARIKIFEVVIQFGSILAVVLLYYQRFWGLIFPKKKPAFETDLAAQSPDMRRSFSGVRGIYLLMLSSLPACILGLLLHKYIKTYLFNPISVAAALAVGALFILFAERWSGQKKKGTYEDKDAQTGKICSLDEITPGLAFGVGCFQCLSLWPGFSRSTSTIMGGLLLGANRAVAAEYSFMAAVPIMAAASAYSLYSGINELSVADIPFFAVGSLMAFLSALAAIKVFIGLISLFSFRPFAWYRLLLAPLVFWLWM